MSLDQKIEELRQQVRSANEISDSFIRHNGEFRSRFVVALCARTTAELFLFKQVDKLVDPKAAAVWNFMRDISIDHLAESNMELVQLLSKLDKDFSPSGKSDEAFEQASATHLDLTISRFMSVV